MTELVLATLPWFVLVVLAIVALSLLFDPMDRRDEFLWALGSLILVGTTIAGKVMWSWAW